MFAVHSVPIDLGPLIEAEPHTSLRFCTRPTVSRAIHRVLEQLGFHILVVGSDHFSRQPL